MAFGWTLLRNPKLLQVVFQIHVHERTLVGLDVFLGVGDPELEAVASYTTSSRLPPLMGVSEAMSIMSW